MKTCHFYQIIVQFFPHFPREKSIIFPGEWGVKFANFPYFPHHVIPWGQPLLAKQRMSNPLANLEEYENWSCMVDNSLSFVSRLAVAVQETCRNTTDDVSRQYFDLVRRPFFWRLNKIPLGKKGLKFLKVERTRRPWTH